MEPLLYRIIYVPDPRDSAGPSRLTMLLRTVSHHPTKDKDFFALHVKQLIFERPLTSPGWTTVTDIVKACSGIRALTAYGIELMILFHEIGNLWVRNITHLEVTLAEVVRDCQWMRASMSQFESLTHMRISFIETSQPSYNAIAPVVQDLVNAAPSSLHILGVTLFLHTPIGQEELLDVVRDIIKVDIRVMVALWPAAGGVDERVRQLSIVRNRSFQWHKNDEFWDEAGAEARARQSGLKKVRSSLIR